VTSILSGWRPLALRMACGTGVGGRRSSSTCWCWNWAASRRGRHRGRVLLPGSRSGMHAAGAGDLGAGSRPRALDDGPPSQGHKSSAASWPRGRGHPRTGLGRGPTRCDRRPRDRRWGRLVVGRCDPAPVPAPRHQQAIQRCRLRLAGEAGSHLAVTEAARERVQRKHERWVPIA